MSDGVILEGNWSVDKVNVPCSTGMASVDTGDEDSLSMLSNGNESRKEIVIHNSYNLEIRRLVDLGNNSMFDYLLQKNWQQGVDSRLGPDLAEE